jgi:hypothetical protein
VDVAVVALGDLEAGVDVRVSVGIRVFIPRQPAYNVAALPDGFLSANFGIPNDKIHD